MQDRDETNQYSLMERTKKRIEKQIDYFEQRKRDTRISNRKHKTRSMDERHAKNKEIIDRLEQEILVLQDLEFLIATIEIIVNEPKTEKDPQKRYILWEEAIKQLNGFLKTHELADMIIKDCLHIIQKEMRSVRLEKAWTSTYDVYLFGEKRKWKYFFLGWPGEHKENRTLLFFKWALFTLGLGVILTPAKNLFKFMMEYFPKWLDAHSENSMTQAKSFMPTYIIANMGHFIFKSCWLLGRAMFSPFASAKAALETGREVGKKVNSKNGGRFVGIGLVALSLLISAGTWMVILSFFPKAMLGWVGEALETGYLLLHPVPLSSVSCAIVGGGELRGSLDVIHERTTSAFVCKRLNMNQNAFSEGSNPLVHRETKVNDSDLMKYKNPVSGSLVIQLKP